MDPRYPYGAPPPMMAPGMPGMPMGYAPPMNPYQMPMGGYPPPMYGGMPPAPHMMPHPGVPPYMAPPMMMKGGVTVAAAPPKPTTETLSLTVTKIPPTVTDDFLKLLLELGGKIHQWKRGTDPLSGAPLKFGFCEYASPEGAARAMRVLNGLSLDSTGGELVLKTDEKAQAAMDGYMKRRRMMLANDAERTAYDTQMAEEDEKARASARELLQMKAAGQIKLPTPAPAAAPVDSAPIIPGGRNDVSGTIGAKDNGLPSAEKERLVKDQIRQFHEAQQKRDQEKAAKAVKEKQEREKAAASAPTPAEVAADEAERERHERERERQRLRDLRERERAADDRERGALEKDARETERAIGNLEHDREREHARRARDRQIRAEDRAAERRAVLVDPLPTPDPLAVLQRGRKRHFESADRERRRRERERERREDEEDRVKEKQEAEQALIEKQQQEERQRKEAEQRRVEEEQRRLAEQQAAQQKPMSPEMRSPHSPVAGEPASSSAGIVIGQLKAAPKKRGPVAVANAAFATDDDADNQWGRGKKLQLQKLDDSIAHQTPAGRNEQAQATEHLNKLLASIPADKASLFAYPMDWAALDANWPTIEKRMRAWVAKKISEYLGEEETSLINFVLTKLKAHAPPSDILHQLALVLDEDAEGFILKMWRLVIFEIMRCGVTKG